MIYFRTLESKNFIVIYLLNKEMEIIEIQDPPPLSPLKPFVDWEKVKKVFPLPFLILEIFPLCTPSPAPEDNINEEENISDSPVPPVPSLGEGQGDVPPFQPLLVPPILAYSEYYFGASRDDKTTGNNGKRNNIQR